MPYRQVTICRFLLLKKHTQKKVCILCMYLLQDSIFADVAPNSPGVSRLCITLLNSVYNVYCKTHATDILYVFTVIKKQFCINF